MVTGRGAEPGDHRSPGGDRGRAARRTGAVLAVVWSVGALLLVGPAGWVALVALVLMGVVVARVTAPDRLAYSTYRDPRATRTGHVATTRVDAQRREDEPSAPAAGLSDDELCWWWRHSFTQLEHATGPEALTRLAEQRRSYLDELERRHPTRFAAWISSGARAASNPTPYLAPHRPPQTKQ